VTADPVRLLEDARAARRSPFERMVRRHHTRLRRVASAYLETYRTSPRFAHDAHEAATCTASPRSSSCSSTSRASTTRPPRA
jgi:hypothetical protein